MVFKWLTTKTWCDTRSPIEIQARPSKNYLVPSLFLFEVITRPKLYTQSSKTCIAWETVLNNQSIKLNNIHMSGTPDIPLKKQSFWYLKTFNQVRVRHKVILLWGRTHRQSRLIPSHHRNIWSSWHSSFWGAKRWSHPWHAGFAQGEGYLGLDGYRNNAPPRRERQMDLGKSSFNRI